MATGSGLLYSFILELRPQASAVIEPTHGYQAYALLLQIIGQRDPPLAEAVHAASGPKPVTISPLRGPTSRRGANLVLSPEKTYWMRVTALSDEVFARLLDALISLPAGQALRLGSASLGLHRFVTAPGSAGWVACSSFTQLLDEARPARRLRLSFESPTVFRSGGRRNVPWPLPELVFGSLLARWNEYSPVLLPEDLRQRAGETLLAARYRLETRMLDFGRYGEIGFVGECEYEVSAAADPEQAAQLAALAGFALYAGVGAKTTMGMGQARALAPAPARTSARS